MNGNIIPAVGPASAYKTYSIHSPADVEIKAACEQVGCAAWLHGWDTTVDERTELGAAQAVYIRTQSRRTFREMRTDMGLTVFRFEAGQRCFAEHKTRPEVYARRAGDWRQGFTGEGYRHQSARTWVEDFGEHQQRLADEQQKG